ncbi:gliding motility protein SprC [Flavobacterium pectinovorum]|uniref:gliding motility protein SprC n=1 Tax=Flavobacterium pectinovorum TaxID=29533 RepID=UPI00265DF79D|nr:gliding motility protein SprC [Flavobacterium pectinovorum]WKL46680.1 gliding motility protein SprC [Flavobacterium pectinovorum]
MYAQTIVPQALDGLEKLCAGGSFNEFYATFSYIDFPAGTTFAIELSDSSGSFTTTVTPTTTLQVTDITSTQQTIKFAVPVTLIGSDVYSLRVKSSTGTVSSRFRNSLGNTSFGAYYKEFEASYFINDKNSSAAICSGGSLTLSIVSETLSPANFPNLKYKWFKDGAIISGQTGKSLVVNAPGEYYSQVDYGVCTEPNISSNRVTVVSSSSGSAVTISSSLGNPFCSNGTGTVLTATSGNSFKWYKDGNEISGATNRSYTTNDSGVYKVDVDFGGCIATGSINLSTNGFDASIDIAENTTIAEGETISVSITTDATSPTYQWYLNESPIEGAESSSYLVAVRGNYKVVISQASGCIATKEFNFRVTGPSGPSTVIPNIIKLSGLNPYWNIPNEYKNTNTKVMIISSNGDMVLDVVDYQGDWPQTSIDFKNVNPVYYYVIQGDAGEKKGSITVIK